MRIVVNFESWLEDRKGQQILNSSLGGRRLLLLLLLLPLLPLRLLLLLFRYHVGVNRTEREHLIPRFNVRRRHVGLAGGGKGAI